MVIVSDKKLTKLRDWLSEESDLVFMFQMIFIIFPDVPFILCFSSPPLSLSVQPNNISSLAYLLCFTLHTPTPPHLCCPPPLLPPLSLPPILRLTSFIHHSLAHLALFPTLSDELTLELRDDGREVGVRGMCRVGRGDVWGQSVGRVRERILKRKDVGESWEENVKDIKRDVRIKGGFCTKGWYLVKHEDRQKGKLGPVDCPVMMN